MISSGEIAVLLVVALLGHVMALLWYIAVKNRWRIAERTIYDLPISTEQIRREMRNSLHTPIHAVILTAFLLLDSFENKTVASFVYSALMTTLWAEIWHYVSHRAFHLRPLHWI